MKLYSNQINLTNYHLKKSDLDSHLFNQNTGCGMHFPALKKSTTYFIWSNLKYKPVIYLFEKYNVVIRNTDVLNQIKVLISKCVYKFHMYILHIYDLQFINYFAILLICLLGIYIGTLYVWKRHFVYIYVCFIFWILIILVIVKLCYIFGGPHSFNIFFILYLVFDMEYWLFNSYSIINSYYSS